MARIDYKISATTTDELVGRAVLCTPFAERRAWTDVPCLSTYTRERRRPELREYFIARRLGSIFISPVPLFTSMI